MTDITRLLASLKRRSAHAKEFGDSITFVKLEDIDALVEALETGNTENERMAREIISRNGEIEGLRRHITELGESHAQVIQSRDHYQRMSEEGLKQLAESRTVTVKLPEFKMLEDYLAEVAVEERKTILLRVRMEFHRLLNDAGIKTEVA
ncbi:hypothetical protein [Klebsiella aerogenes]|uniref:hypothetical protein n=1 Tax=Klebsiella aerogenes TaxID=548 RepID=UPI00163CE643|nr:hypothetical protein [Klebsiella aerogenes]